MSKKSRARTKARQAEKQTASDLELKKAHIRDASSEQVIYLILWGGLPPYAWQSPCFFSQPRSPFGFSPRHRPF